MLARDALATEIRALPAAAKVLDVGCMGLSLYRACREIRGDLQHHGCDIAPCGERPGDFEFRQADLRTMPIPFDDDAFDLVVASHLIEHLPDPVALFGELLRVCRPGGTLYVEAPSDRSTWLSSPVRQDLALILSYWDDPTHVGRPWTPQAFYRLARYYGCAPRQARYDFSARALATLMPGVVRFLLRRDVDRFVEHWWHATGWACFCVVDKPPDLRGRPPFQYFSFKGRAGAA